MPKSRALPQINEDGLVFGNKDIKEQFPFKAGWLTQVVVTQIMVERLSTGNEVVNEATRRLMPYEPQVFDKLQKTGGFGEFQYTVLHDPR
jgi:hypothetical protein